jgi:hypothetical protein
MDDGWAAAVRGRRIAARSPAINDLFAYTRTFLLDVWCYSKPKRQFAFIEAHPQHAL